MTAIVETFKNIEDGVESYVTSGYFGFHVSLKDTDSGEFLGICLCYKDKHKALSKAQEIVS
jgi:hypothetical protein